MEIQDNFNNSVKKCILFISSNLSWLILLLGPVLEYLGELIVVKHSVLDWRLSVHLVHLVISEPVPDGGEQLPQSVLVYEPHVVFVEAAEGVLNDVLRVSSLVKPLVWAMSV